MMKKNYYFIFRWTIYLWLHSREDFANLYKNEPKKFDRKYLVNLLRFYCLNDGEFYYGMIPENIVAIVIFWIIHYSFTYSRCHLYRSRLEKFEMMT